MVFILSSSALRIESSFFELMRTIPASLVLRVVDRSSSEMNMDLLDSVMSVYELSLLQDLV